MAKKNFDSNYVEPGNNNDSDNENFEQMLNESFLQTRKFDIGEEVEAKVIGHDKDHVFLDMGTRMDGMVRKQELMRNGKLIVKDGERINVFVTGKENGLWLCSCRLLANEVDDRGHREQDPQKIASLMALEEAYNQNLNVEGTVIGVIKGGFEVQVKSLRAFCPLSQIDTSYCDNPEEHVNKVYTFKIMDFAETGNNIVVSRKEYLKNEASKKADKMWRKVEEGEIYNATVTAIRDYGAFVDIGGIEGLLHISEISYERIKRTEDKLNVGEQIEVAVMEVDRQNRKLSLSLKALMKDPWTAALKKLTPGSEVQGKVVRLKTYGAFIELFPGVDGMVHISKLGTDRNHRHPKEVLKIGDIVTVRILEIDEENRRISLSMEKEEGDYSDDLAQLKKEQEIQSASSPMSESFDKALKDQDTD